MRSDNRLPVWASALIGLVTGAVAIGVSLLAAGLVKASAFPVFAVGNAAVDLTPAGLKDFAIRTFGENDKPVLLAGIFAVMAVLAVAVGVFAARDLRYGLAGLAAFGVVGLAAVLTRPDAGPVDAIPTVAGVAVGAIALRALLRRASAARDDGTRDDGTRDGDARDGDARDDGVRDGDARPEETGPPVMRAGRDRYAVNRRGLLTGVLGGAAVAGVSGLAGRALSGRSEVSAARVGLALPRPAVPAKPLPAGTDLRIRGLTPFVTPNRDFYRVDTAIVVPQVDPRDWTLRIGGMVDRPVELTLADLLKRPLVEEDVTLCCVSNPVGGHYTGNARWLGARLADVLRDAGVRSGADMLLSTSADGWTCGTPLDVVLDGRDALLAVAMNGEALPVDHGFPVRQVVPGLYGYVSATKWVTEIKVTRFDQDTAYWTTRGWAEKGPIKTQSRIDLPRDGGSVPAGRTVIAGVAWAQHRGVDAVEVRVDGGSWLQARLAEAPTADTWRQWVVDDWDAVPGRHTIEVRATDATGHTQTAQRAPVTPDGATGWHAVTVTVT
ncbi:molybdopterin-dependent oxidoreductase [Streptosporangium sp. NPDC004379]|uniref:molybdopterin-dependent oxidoreductase n=1 Tax=Streptosporangium sp. NPDC004379 TaxID=3366189 RepID=UPI0036A069C7